jgi:N-acyl-D-amino-acid deacylase
MRSESNQFIESIDETLRIRREAKLPVKIHHLKAAGRPNWQKMDIAIDKIEALRREGIALVPSFRMRTK